MKQVITDNFRVILTPRDYNDLGYAIVSRRNVDPAEVAKEMEERCREIAKSVRRHVDDVTHVEVKFDTRTECKFCGSDWEGALTGPDDVDPEDPNSEVGYPVCCPKAQRAYWEVTKGQPIPEPGNIWGDA